jgi:hypothetical protein
MLVDRGALDLDAPVCSFWPEFEAEGKGEVPVRWLLTHQSGVLGVDRPVTQDQLLDWNYKAKRLATQRPLWAPGTKPQSPQNRLPAGLSAPHRGHRFASAAPQSPQNRLSSEF